MELLLVQVPQNVGPLQVEFPEHQINERGRPVMEGEGKNKKPVPFGDRSCKGAMHLRPSSTKKMTQAELDYIRANHTRKLRVVSKPHPKAKKASESASKPASKPAPSPTIAEPSGSTPVEFKIDAADDKGKKGKK